MFFSSCTSQTAGVVLQPAQVSLQPSQVRVDNLVSRRFNSTHVSILISARKARFVTRGLSDLAQNLSATLKCVTSCDTVPAFGEASHPIRCQPWCIWTGGTVCCPVHTARDGLCRCFSYPKFHHKKILFPGEKRNLLPKKALRERMGKQD